MGAVRGCASVFYFFIFVSSLIYWMGMVVIWLMLIGVYCGGFSVEGWCWRWTGFLATVLLVFRVLGFYIDSGYLMSWLVIVRCW